MIFEETVVLSKPFDAVLAALKFALAAEGFGTLTEIDMQATLKAKVDRDIGRYVIVGACNPKLAIRALDVVPQIGVLLPCNVVVREILGPNGGEVVVEAMDPGLMANVTGNDEMAPIAADARELIGNALARVAAGE